MLNFKWIGIEEEEIPTLKRARQLEDDALQDHLRLLPLTSRTGVVEEAWAKVNGVRARAVRDHEEWRHKKALGSVVAMIQEGRLVMPNHHSYLEPGAPVFATADGRIVSEGHPDTVARVGVALEAGSPGSEILVQLT